MSGQGRPWCRLETLAPGASAPGAVSGVVEAPSETDGLSIERQRRELAYPEREAALGPSSRGSRSRRRIDAVCHDQRMDLARDGEGGIDERVRF